MSRRPSKTAGIRFGSKTVASPRIRRASQRSGPAYSIVIPPPNVTGVLTLGHVLNNTIQDILARRARMLGKEVLWLPGTDHAGIATQNVVEKTLRKEGAMKHRDELGREVLVGKIWEWKEKYGGIIIQQLKKLGASCDWSRERFTMDAEYSRCVQQVFVDLYKKGLIYRGKRMVNWCPASLTALSDEEVIMKEQNGALYYFRVEVVEEPGRFLTIATTRPETIPGDSGVAVNPADPRYADLIGKHVRRPLPRENQAHLPIVGDGDVAFDFGTGVLKVTPAHDKTDFEIGQRHNLEVIDIMHPNAVLNDLAGADLAGMERFAARKKAVEILTELGAIEKEEPYKNNVGYSERADVPIEPRLSEQWFLKYPSAEKSREVVSSGEMKFFPDRWAKVYDHWMEGIQDWCISRQLWWGHRIPVWYRDGETYCGMDAPEGSGWTQDPDVLDTWFSSWLWPFATMGWPEKTETLKAFYPTTDLVTGPDIIFFWVARMIMAGFEYMGELPFRNVYFTGIIRDKQGRKMSKSLGNSPDPLDLISKYGADALRFGVMRSAPLGADVVYDEKNVELGRNFCTKLWNAARFRQMQGGATEGEIIPQLLTADDKWILLRLDNAVMEVSAALEEYRFSDATQALYRFFWSEFCDWYLECSKAALATIGNADAENGAREFANPPLAANTLAVMDFVLSHTLRLFHPFLPFITEELWQGMGFNPRSAGRPGWQDDHERPLAAAPDQRRAPLPRRRSFKRRVRPIALRSGERRTRIASRFQHREQQARPLRAPTEYATERARLRGAADFAERRTPRVRGRRLVRAERHAHCAQPAWRAVPAARRPRRRRRRARTPGQGSSQGGVRTRQGPRQARGPEFQCESSRRRPR
jgi:valyl-tRNA synthetase